LLNIHQERSHQLNSKEGYHVNHRRVALIFSLTIMVIMLALPFVVRADEPATAPAAAAAPAVIDAPDPTGAPPHGQGHHRKEAGKPVLAEIADAVVITRSPST